MGSLGAESETPEEIHFSNHQGAKCRPDDQAGGHQVAQEVRPAEFGHPQRQLEGSDSLRQARAGSVWCCPDLVAVPPSCQEGHSLAFTNEERHLTISSLAFGLEEAGHIAWTASWKR